MREPRTISFDDGFFECWRGRTLLVGVVMRKSVLEGVCSRPVRVDGADVTPAIISMVKGSKHRQCLQCVFLAGVTFAGACVADVERIRDETGLPVVVVSRRRPDKSAVLRSLRHLPDAVGREALLDVLGDAHRFGSVFFQVVGASAVDAKRFIGESRVNSSMPEGLRVAHLVACGLTRGESAGRA